MTTSLATAVIPVPRERAAAVNQALDTYGSGANFLNTRAQLDAERFIHFMSLVLVPAEGDAKNAHLVVEVAADAHPSEALRRAAYSAEQPLEAIMQVVDGHPRNADQLASLLVSSGRQFEPAGRFVGLQFAGTLDLTVRRILQEAELAKFARLSIDAMPPGPALQMLDAVRAQAFADPAMKWAFVAEPAQQILAPRPIPGPASFWFMLARQLAPTACIGVGIAALGGWFAGKTFQAAVLGGGIAAAAIAVSFAAIAFMAYRLLRKREREDVPLDMEPAPEVMQEIRKREDQSGCVQNHLFGVSVMKPGWYRGLLLALTLAAIGHRAKTQRRAGYVDKIGSIHFARWMRLPGTKQLVFLSNYDGSWQSYLEDFIARLREGLTSVWTNTRDFPRTENLFEGGAGDGARFKRWARRQQLPTRFWYSAYPGLSAARIRANVAIRHGFASARTEDEAAKWLGAFGFAGRDALEVREIPVLAFGGLKTLPFATAMVVRLPGVVADAKDFLRTIRPVASFGDRNPETEAVVLGLTATALTKLGTDDCSLQSFPLAFRQGMAEAQRLRMLGDDPALWLWDPAASDALVMVYADGGPALARRVAFVERELRQRGGAVVRQIETGQLSLPPTEPFGFRDGISQPVMRGTLRESREPDSIHLVHPGELVLGYRDNLGVVPPTPRSCGRDIGRNGTYLVVRELEQDVAGFNTYLAQTASRLVARADPRIPTGNAALVEEWLAAKMVGRWRDGSSLLRNPRESLQATLAARTTLSAAALGPVVPPPPAPPPAIEPDNRFLFGREDPDGLRCPFGAHIRRANPRESFDPGSEVQIEISNRHRILRVGRRSPPSQDRGEALLFMCINADLERQFEFLQQTWLMGPDFHGLDDESDPLMGCAQRGMTIPTPNGPLRLPPLAAFVTSRGGGYFFLPSRTALDHLAA